MSNMSSYEGDFLVNDSYLEYQIARERLLLSLDNNTGRLFSRTTGWITNGAPWITRHTYTYRDMEKLSRIIGSLWG